MTDPFLSRCIDNTRHFEGVVPWLYLDTRGNVTVGIGKMLPTIATALSLPFKFIQDTEAATSDEIEKDWTRIKGLPYGPKFGARFYKATTSVYLVDGDINSLLAFTLQPLISGLEKAFPRWGEFTEGIKAALVDMAYNLGLNGLLHGYPRLVEAVMAGNWGTAALECERLGVSEDRNSYTKRQFLEAVEGV